MSQQQLSEYHREHPEDKLRRVARWFYLAAGVLFIGGLFADWQLAGQNFIPMFRLADEPHANSGLFILALIVGVVGYLFTVAGNLLESRRMDNKEPEEKDQEWELDIS